MMTTLRILIIKPSSLGDVIQMLQVVEGAYHAAHKHGFYLDIHWVIRDCFSELIKMSPIISKCFIFQRHGGLKAFYRLIKEIRKFQYDYVIDGQGLLRSGLMTFFAHSKVKIGRKDAREGSRFFYKKTYAPSSEKIHALEILQALFKGFHFEITPQRPLSLTIPETDYPFKDFILLFPNSRVPKKEWPYFIELTQKILSQTQYSCVWAGTDPLKTSFQHPRFFNEIGKTHLSDLPGLIQKACCIIANDSGPIHLAAALKQPLVGIYGAYGASGIFRYGPYPVSEHCILQADNNDLKSLSPEVVYKAVMQQINFKV